MQTLSFSSPKISTRTIAYMGMFIAMQVVLSRFSFGVSWLKISPAFFATILMGYYLGPWMAGITAALADQIGTLIFNPGVNFLGFTFSAALAAVLYGMFFHGHKVTVLRSVLGVLAVIVICNIFLTTLWLDMMGTPWQGIIVVRTLKNLVMWPIQSTLVFLTLRSVERIKPRVLY